MCNDELRDPDSPKLRLKAELLAGGFVEAGRIFSFEESCLACFRSLGDLQLFASLSSPLSPWLRSACPVPGDCWDCLALLSLKLFSLDIVLSAELGGVDWWTEMLGSLLDCSFSECFFFLAFIALITISSKSNWSWSQRKPLDYPLEKEKTHEATALMEFKASYREQPR